MACAIRIEYESVFYHVTNRGNERKKDFLCQIRLWNLNPHRTKMTDAPQDHPYLGNHAFLKKMDVHRSMAIFLPEP